jgi:uncharacterized protein (TIGR02117 family)
MGKQTGKQTVRRTLCQWARFSGLTIVAYGLSLGLGTQIPRRMRTQVTACSSQTYSVYLVGDVQHIDFLVPVQNDAYDWHKFFDLQSIGRDRGGEYQYLKFGWGDRDFYMNTPSLDKIQMSRLVRTLFWPGNPTAVHVNGYQNLPNESDHLVRCVGLTRSHYLELVNYLQRSFRNGKPDRIQDGFVAAAGFYEGSGTYSIAYTCNSWVADGLNEVDVTTPLWSGLALPVMGKLTSD